ncbi:MAG TPA: nickel pincer cofactor biosynthesis protein LarC, partial [Candidatus Dormibacteraeota bacterium]|nr:nickel pincer cofactor biosynthesis protein LarC [Candidatus Dormibacteraeota bacterium]
MTIAYFDCFSGISGDMTLGALLDCGAERSVLDAAVEALRLGDEVTIDVRHETRGHAGGTRVIVGVDDRVERTVPALREVVEASAAPDGVKKRALEAVNRLARAEAAVHGVPEEKAHLHELGGADTLVDIVGAFWLLDSLEVGRVYSSALPISRPGPATLKILEGTGAELRPGDEGRELVTPTGAAILATAATFTRPAMSLRRAGYGVGTHPSPGNLLAVWIGDEIATDRGVTMIETNLDDMAPNLIAALAEDLMAAGALDVAVVPALMKKGRPGHVLTVMSPPALAARLSDLLLRRSTTLGVRVMPVQRVLADRRIIEVTTALGSVRVKVKELDGRAVDV